MFWTDLGGEMKILGTHMYFPTLKFAAVCLNRLLQLLPTLPLNPTFYVLIHDTTLYSVVNKDLTFKAKVKDLSLIHISEPTRPY